MNKEQENKLLAFFAANADEHALKPYHVFPFPSPDNDPPKVRFRYAKVMVEKYKEFCNLLDDNPTSKVTGK